MLCQILTAFLTHDRPCHLNHLSLQFVFSFFYKYIERLLTRSAFVTGTTLDALMEIGARTLATARHTAGAFGTGLVEVARATIRSLSPLILLQNCKHGRRGIIKQRDQFKWIFSTKSTRGWKIVKTNIKCLRMLSWPITRNTSTRYYYGLVELSHWKRN